MTHRWRSATSTASRDAGSEGARSPGSACATVTLNWWTYTAKVCCSGTWRNRQRPPCLDGVRVGNRVVDRYDGVSRTTGQDRDHGRSRHQWPVGHDLDGSRSATGIQAVAIERCSDLAEPLRAQLAPVRELVASIPAPRCDHRQREDPALA